MSAKASVKPKRSTSRETTSYKPNATTPQFIRNKHSSPYLKTPKTDPPKRHSSETTPQNRTLTDSKDEAGARRLSEMTPKRVLNSKSKGSTSTPECYKPIYIGTPMSFTKSTQPNDSITFKDVPAGEEDSSVIVAIRVRPLNQREIDDPEIRSVIEVSDCTVTVKESEGYPSRLQFSYDHCFWSADRFHLHYADQKKVFETIAQPLLDKAFQGYNTCLFAYGQTGSGKSYSIMGQQDWEPGIVTRFSKDLFERINCSNNPDMKISVEISFFEIYNEKIHDLLASSADQNKNKAPMRVREHPVLGPYVVDLSTFVVTCYEDLASWLSLGNKQRATASTGMNEKSSRSHSVVTIVITQTEVEMIEGEPQEHSRKSKVNLVDLAGSERINTSKTTGSRTKEGVSINKSLLTLGKVISQLAELSLAGNSKKVFVPYRESVLTWLLKESLGGNSKTTMLATISPTNIHVEETLSTLRYAKQARNIVNVARVNDDPKAKLIKDLRAEIEKLNRQQGMDAPFRFEAAQDEINALREKLRDSEELLQKATQSWKEKLQQAMKRKAEEAESLQKVGIAFQINNQLPNLVNLNEDPQLSETLLYLLREGDTRIGRMHLNSSQNIQLKGTLILDYHCTISNIDNKVVTLIPNNDGHTYINGHLISEPTKLFHGDRVILGGEHYFRFNNPLETRQSLHESDEVKDFLYAKSELLNVQEAQLKAALEKEREKTRQEMLEEIEAVKKESDLELCLQKQEFENRIHELNTALDEQHQEIEKSESTRFQLEIQNKLLQQEIEIEKQMAGAEEGVNLDNLVPMQTNFLDEIVEYLAIDEDTVIEKQDRSSRCIGLYELSVMIKEANNICKDLDKQIVFSQCDRLTPKGLEIIVKVQDVAQNLKLDCSISQFQAKLDLLHRIVEDEEEVDIFDAGDIWEKDEHLTLSFSTKVLDTLQRLPSYRGDSSHSNLSFSFSDVSDSFNMPTARRSILPKRQENLDAKVFLNCREHCTSLLQNFNEMCPSTAGKDVTRMLCILSAMNDFERDLKDTINTTTVSSENCIIKLIMGLSSQFRNAILQASRISALFSLRLQKVCDLREQFVNAINKLGNAVSFIIQGMETETESLVQESIVKLNDGIFQCCKVTGQVTASLGLCIQQEGHQALGVKKIVSLHFIGGLESIVQKALRAAVERLEDAELQINMLADVSFIEAVQDKRTIVYCCQETTIALWRWASKYIQIQNITNESRSQCCEHAILISAQVKQIIINFASLTEVLSNLFHKVEIFVKEDCLDSMGIIRYISDIRGIVDAVSSLTYLHLEKRAPSGSTKVTTNSELEKQFKCLQECIRGITTSTQKFKKATSTLARGSGKTEPTDKQRSNVAKSTLRSNGTVLHSTANLNHKSIPVLNCSALINENSASISKRSYMNDSEFISPTKSSSPSKSKTSIWSSNASIPSSDYTEGSPNTLSGLSSFQMDED